MSKNSEKRNSDAVHPFIVELRQDHARFSRVLLMISRYAPALENDYQSILPLFEEAVDYIINFQNIYHHPREELFFDHICAKSPSLKSKTGQLSKEHMKMGRAGKKMLRQLRSLKFSGDTIPSRAALVRSLIQFSEDMRIHIRTEEEFMYAQATSLLTKRDWSTISREGLPSDPLENAMSETYPLLSEYIANSSDIIQVDSEHMGCFNRQVKQIRNGIEIATRQAGEFRELVGQTISEIPFIPVFHPMKTWSFIQHSGVTALRAGNRWGQDWRDWRKDTQWKLK